MTMKAIHSALPAPAKTFYCPWLSVRVPALLLASTLLAAGPLQASDFTVQFTSRWTFDTDSLQIQCGDRVQWLNTSGDSFYFDSLEDLWPPTYLRQGEAFFWTYAKAGVYQCRCRSVNAVCTITVTSPSSQLPPSPVLIDAHINSPATLGFSVSNLVSGKQFVIEVSTNLTDWLPLSTNMALSNLESWSTPISATAQSRFFRAQALP